jgi:hypothetical protein
MAVLTRMMRRHDARRTHRLTGAASVRQLETRSHMIVDIPENR